MTDKTNITQADREWFKIIVPFSGSSSEVLAGLQAVDRGEFDDNSRMIAIATHREQATAELEATDKLQAENERLREAASELLKACEARANLEGGDYGPIVGPPAHKLEAVLASAEAWNDQAR